MNKQELLKKYPELLKEIAQEVAQIYTGERPGSFFAAFDQYVKEQTKPEWEILSIKVSGGFIATLREDNTYVYKHSSGSGGGQLKDLLEIGSTIHSIRRTLDNEVFTVGDKVSYQSGSDGLTIESFKYTSGKVFVKFIAVPNSYDDWLSPNFHKLSPLFTTKDGVDMYEGDEYWYLGEQTNPWTALSHRTTSKEVGLCAIGHVQFSTEEAAEEYILMNKPVLSVQDVWNLYGGHIDSPEQLRELAKSKL